MRFLPTHRLCRLAATGLAVTGLLGHGLAMLLVALLAGGPASAAASFYGEICAASGSAAADDSAPQSGEGVPRPAQGHVDACPVCTAFAHCGPGALPAPVALPGADGGGGGWQQVAETAPPACGRLAAQSRGPPATA
ncbi:MAG TPA: hypothetical protein VKP12_16960 [Kiloniellaceae bacterium]|nr:hypothetical protein [Kiloniellaceae bacterium]